MVERRKRVKVRTGWGPMMPATKVIPDKRLRPHRRRKHKGRSWD